jgi:hypothetical protein
MSVRVCETQRSAIPEHTSLRAESSVLFLDPEFPRRFPRFLLESRQQPNSLKRSIQVFGAFSVWRVIRPERAEW